MGATRDRTAQLGAASTHPATSAPAPPASDSLAPTLQKQGPPHTGGWQSQQRGHTGSTSPAGSGASRSGRGEPGSQPGARGVCTSLQRAGESARAHRAARTSPGTRKTRGAPGGRAPRPCPSPGAPRPAPCAPGASAASRWSWSGAALTVAGSCCVAGCCWRRRRRCGCERSRWPLAAGRQRTGSRAEAWASTRFPATSRPSRHTCGGGSCCSEVSRSPSHSIARIPSAPSPQCLDSPTGAFTRRPLPKPPCWVLFPLPSVWAPAVQSTDALDLETVQCVEGTFGLGQGDPSLWTPGPLLAPSLESLIPNEGHCVAQPVHPPAV